MALLQTAERVTDDIKADNYVYQRCLAAYTLCAPMIGGEVLEIGTGSGYGVEKVAPLTKRFVTIDKFKCALNVAEVSDNIEFIQMTIPPIVGIDNDSFDYVICFQVLEHIQEDKAFLKEIYRVLRPGGKLILTTPNRLTTLSRNPWHIREYTIQELEELMAKVEFEVDTRGVYGSEMVMRYYEDNKKSVERLTKWDFLNLQWRLPRVLLQIPFDVMNRINRKNLHKNNNALVEQITQEDFFLREADERCLDLFFIASK